MKTKNSINIQPSLPLIPPASRLDWLDRVKGIAILFVMIGHVYIKDSFPSRIIHTLNVPLFFIVSGYLLCAKREWERSGQEILKRKIRSILYPYFTYSALMMAWLLVRFFLFHYGSTQEMLHCLADIFCLEGISVLWFLSALWIGQLLVLFSQKFLYQHQPNNQKNQNSASQANLKNQNSASQAVVQSICQDAGQSSIYAFETILLFLLFTLLALAMIYFIPWVQQADFGGAFGKIIQKLLLKASRILGRGITAGSFMLMGTLIRLAEENDRQKLYQSLYQNLHQEQHQTLHQEQHQNLHQTLHQTRYSLLCLPLALLGLWYNGLCDFHYLSFGIFPIYLLNAFFGFMVIASIGRLLSRDKLLSFIGQNSLMMMGTHLIFLDFINIMAIILSVSTGRYLGDAWEVKLIILLAAEFLLVSLRRPK